MTKKSISPSEKSYVVAVCVSAIFGVMGIHHFYLGRYLEGIIDFSLFVATVVCFFLGEIGWSIFFLVVDSMHTLIITIMLLTGSFKDGRGKTVCYPGQRIS